MAKRDTKREHRPGRSPDGPKAAKVSTNLLLMGAGAVGILVVATLFLWPGVQADPTEITVYKSPTCGCCVKWVDYLEDNGFSVITKDVRDLRGIKSAHGITRGLASCHTAMVDGYVIEGHVPATDIQRLLAERPAVKGLAVPGMPMGSPGMEGPRKDSYEVLTFDSQGKTTVFSRH